MSPLLLSGMPLSWRAPAVQISYNVLQTFPSGANPSIQMKACYSNFSQYDRPWRKANPTISVSCTTSTAT